MCQKGRSHQNCSFSHELPYGNMVCPLVFSNRPHFIVLNYKRIKIKAIALLYSLNAHKILYNVNPKFLCTYDL